MCINTNTVKKIISNVKRGMELRGKHDCTEKGIFMKRINYVLWTEQRDNDI